MNIGLIGAGAIANFLLQELNEREQKGLSIQSIYVRDKEKYAVLGIDTDAVIEKLKTVPVSLHCWQGDDVISNVKH